MFFKVISIKEYKRRDEFRYSIEFAAVGETFQQMGHKIIGFDNLESKEQYKLGHIYQLSFEELEEAQNV